MSVMRQQSQHGNIGHETIGEHDVQRLGDRLVHPARGCQAGRPAKQASERQMEQGKARVVDDANGQLSRHLARRSVLGWRAMSHAVVPAMPGSTAPFGLNGERCAHTAPGPSNGAVENSASWGKTDAARPRTMNAVELAIGRGDPHDQTEQNGDEQSSIRDGASAGQQAERPLLYGPSYHAIVGFGSKVQLSVRQERSLRVTAPPAGLHRASTVPRNGGLSSPRARFGRFLSAIRSRWYCPPK